MSPGLTNTDMFSGKAQAEAALSQAEDALEESQRENVAMKYAMEDIEIESAQLSARIRRDTLELQKLIADLRTKFKDV